jgi:predicted acetyltransferase
MQVELAEAKDAFEIVRNLFDLYVHDLSGYAGIDIGEDGKFAPPASLSLYWSDADRHPFLIRADGRVAGFALVRKIGPATHDVGEFFVLRRYRRFGVGREAACRLFDRFKGGWEVRELTANTPAQEFWRRIIADYSAGDFQDALEFFPAYRREFVVQRFRSNAR